MSSTVYYILCVILSIAVLIGLSMLSKIKTAVTGNLISAFSVLGGIIVTLIYNGVASVWSIYIYIVIGALIGGMLASRVKMIQMPQMVALLNGIGGGASALVGILLYMQISVSAKIAFLYPAFCNVTSMLAIVIGLITLVGSLVAAGKLHGKINQRPVVWKNHSSILIFCLTIMLILVVLSGFAFKLDSGGVGVTVVITLVLSIIFSAFFGYAFAIRVGGADMPITISLLNSLSGVAGAIAGMAANDLLLVAVGGIVGASGLLLTQIMCRAMNRNLVDILTGKTSVVGKKVAEATQTAVSANADEVIATAISEDKSSCNDSAENAPTIIGKDKEGNVQAEINFDEFAKDENVAKQKTESLGEILSSAHSIIIVPGYGMALAQAQHQVKQLADKLEAGGASVRYAIHPVAGRMPGHMNVLLAEADVSYEKLFPMEDINDDFVNTDLVIVVGANDVLNPAARNAEGTPIYGMPVLNVDKAKEVIICNYDLKPGYAGVDNPLYGRKQGVHLLLGDAKESLNKLLNAI